MNKIYKIFGAVAIIGLFFISSMSTGLGATQQTIAIKGQQQPSTPPGYSEPPASYYQWNGQGGLPSYDGDGQDGMMFYGNTYPLPVQGDFPSYYSLNFNPTGIIFNNPQYVVYYIAVKRRDDGGLLGKSQQFKAVIANIGQADPFEQVQHKITVWHLCIPHTHTEGKAGIALRFSGIRIITSPQILTPLFGSTVVCNPNYQNSPNQQFPGLLRVRRAVSNWICPFSSLTYDALIDI